VANAAGEMAGCFVRWAVLKCVVYAPYHRKYFRVVYKVNVSPLLRIYEDLVSAICDNGTKGLLPLRLATRNLEDGNWELESA